jgi:Na+/melibiose symporter-like transporter
MNSVPFTSANPLHNNHLHWRELLAYGGPGLPLAFLALPLYVQVQHVYAVELGMNLALLGTVLLLARLVDAVQDPFLGVIADRIARRQGQRYSLMRWLVAPMILFFFLLFSPLVTGDAFLAVWLLVSLVAIYSGYSLFSISYMAAGAELSRDYHQRTRITGAREAFALAGVLLAVSLPEILRQQVESGKVIFWLTCAFAAMFMLAVYCYGRRFSTLPVPEKSERIRYRDFFLTFLHRPFRQLALIFFINGLAASLPATLILFYVEDILGAKEQAAGFLFAYFLAGAVGVAFWVRLAGRISKKGSWLVAMILATISFFSAFFLSEGDVLAFYGICLASGLCLGANLALPSSLLADVMDAPEKTGESLSGGVYFGVWNFLSKFSLALAAGMTLPLLEWGGYQPAEENSAAALQLLSAAYALLPCLLQLIAAALLWRWQEIKPAMVLASPLSPTITSQQGDADA